MICFQYVEMDITIKQIENESQLKSVLDMCYRILGQKYRSNEFYNYEKWLERLKNKEIMLFAEYEGHPISAVLGRVENKESIVIGFVACDEKYRMKGITKKLMKQFEERAEKSGFKYITLGAQEDACGFYEKCDYHVIKIIDGQKIYQKLL